LHARAALDHGIVVAIGIGMHKRILIGASVAATMTMVAVLVAPAISAKTKADDGVGQRRLSREISVTLSNACAYHASVVGTVDGVREHGTRVVQLVPDLHVTATLDCPRERPVIVSRHVAKTIVGDAELDEAIRGAMSIPTGGCFYVPDVRRAGMDLNVDALAWMCPSPPVSIGGGPQSQK
jgi:hypothetical protein